MTSTVIPWAESAGPEDVTGPEGVAGPEGMAGLEGVAGLEDAAAPAGTVGQAEPVGLAGVAHQAAATLMESDACGMLLTVPTGLGAEPLLRGILEATPVPQIAIRGMAALKDMDFGALAPLLNGSGSLHCPLEVLAAIRARLAEQAADGPVIVVVRNAAELDDSSVSILAQLCADPRVKLLVHARSHGCLPEGFALLAAEGRLASAEMPQLRAREIQAWCKAETGTYTPYVTALTLQHATAGNPVFISYLLRDAATGPQMCVDENVRILERRLVPSPTMTADVVGLLDGYSPAEREVLTAVALAGKLALCTLSDIWDGEVSNNLLLEKVLVRACDGSERVNVQPAMLSDAIAAATGVFTRRELWQRLEPYLKNATAPETVLARVQWQLSIGEKPAAHDLVSAAATSNRLDDPHTALALLDELDDDAAGQAGMLQRSRALFYLGSIESALQCASKLVEPGQHDGAGGTDGAGHADGAGGTEGAGSVDGAGNIEAAGHIDYRRLLILLAQIRLSTGKGAELLDAAASRWKDMDAGGGYAAKQARERHLLMLSAVEQLSSGASFPTALAAAAPDGPDDGGREALIRQLLLGEAAARSGEIAVAAESLSAALEIVLADEELRNYGAYVLIRLLLVLCLGGYWDRLDGWLDRLALHSAPWLTQLAGLGELAAGIRLLQQGRPGDAMEALHAAVVILRHKDIRQLLPLAAGVAACTAGMSGDAASAARYQQEFRSLPSAGVPFVAAYATAFAAVARTPNMDAAAVRSELSQLLTEAAGAGARRSEIEITALLLQFDRTVPPSRLAELTSGVDDPRAQALHSYALALEAGDSAGLLGAGEAAAGLGQSLIAANALSRVILQTGEGRVHRVSPAATALLGQLHPQAQQLYPRLLELRTRSKLTVREKEIAAGIAAGRTSRQLAADAGVSVRTVDGHVHRIMGKLGLTSRKDLQHATSE
ncbi:helix-turn-helix transcriptional regulator [Arthrobacter pigmenti]